VCVRFVFFRRTWSARLKSLWPSAAHAAAALLFVMAALPPRNAKILGTKKADGGISAWPFDQQSDCASNNAVRSKDLMRHIGISLIPFVCFVPRRIVRFNSIWIVFFRPLEDLSSEIEDFPLQPPVRWLCGYVLKSVCKETRSPHTYYPLDFMPSTLWRQIKKNAAKVHFTGKADVESLVASREESWSDLSPLAGFAIFGQKVICFW
jgi:hypothetical protein